MTNSSLLPAPLRAELHLHLEGSIRPATLLALARKNKIALPATDEAGLAHWFRYRDFRHFIEVYLGVTRCLKDAADYELVVVDLAAELARQNVVYAEVTVTPGTARMLGVAPDALPRGLAAGRERARREHGVDLRWIFDIVRNLPEQQRANACDFTLAAAIEGMGEGVVALGLGGMEAGHPPGPFAPWFERAKAAGLRSTPHAGEGAGPESVWSALRELHADRIGHGVRAIEDPRLIEHLVEHGITLEVCPTSNLRLNIYPDYAAHPLPRLIAAGVRVTLGSDDPPLFNTTIADEFALLESVFALDSATREQIRMEGARASFLPDVEKALLEARLRQAADPHGCLLDE